MVNDENLHQISGQIFKIRVVSCLEYTTSLQLTYAPDPRKTFKAQICILLLQFFYCFISKMYDILNNFVPKTREILGNI